MSLAAWNEYRGWAKAARQLQAQAQNWTRLSIGLVISAAILAAATTWVSEASGWAQWISILAGMATAVGTFVASQARLDNAESSWVSARAVAESIKSECFRYAAKLPPYDQGDPSKGIETFQARRSEISAVIGNTLSAQHDDIDKAEADKRCPPADMTADWYIDNRLKDQKKYYAAAQEHHNAKVKTARVCTIVAGVIGALFGAIGAKWSWVAPLVATATTVFGAIIAYSMAERNRGLSVLHSSMIVGLNRILELHAAGQLSLQQLVERTEALLRQEHEGWLNHMQATAKKDDPARSE